MRKHPKTIAENFLNMEKETVNQVEEAQRLLSRTNPRRNTRHIVIKLTKIKDKDNINVLLFTFMVIINMHDPIILLFNVLGLFYFFILFFSFLFFFWQIFFLFLFFFLPRDVSEDLPNPGMEPGSPALEADTLTSATREAQN